MPMMEAARIPALVAPFRATVATGMPEGIWRMDRMESHPSMELDDLMGTPMTGSVVREATMPGRWAAPPAPAMITRRPLSRAVREYLIMRSGVRWAETIVNL